MQKGTQEVEDDETAKSEIEAAEALASSVSGESELSNQGPSIESIPTSSGDVEKKNDGQSSRQKNIQEEEYKIGTNSSSNSLNMSTENLMETEYEPQRTRRVSVGKALSWQAIHADLTEKVAELVMENGNLKREIGEAMKEYDLLKDRNQMLKDQMARLMKGKEKEVQEESSPFHAKKSSSASVVPPLLLNNQPSIMPPSNVQLQPAFGLSIPLHYPMRLRDMPSTSQEEERSPMAVDGARIPLSALAVPWLFPVEQRTSIQEHGTSDPSAASLAPEHMEHNLPDNIEESNVEPGDMLEHAVTAAEARKRRKELRKLKQLHCKYDNTRTKHSGKNL